MGSQEEYRQIMELLARLQERGQLSDMLNQLPSTSATSEAAGSMHDGSKRRLEHWEIVTGPTQEPVEPKSAKQSKPVEQTAGQSIALPEDVKDVETWGRTLVTLPKYAARKLSYSQMVSQAAQDMSEGDMDLHDYLQYVKKNHKSDKSAKLQDFGAYLHAVHWDEGPSATTYLPNSRIPRRFVD